jgi:hypothetical protein
MLMEAKSIRDSGKLLDLITSGIKRPTKEMDLEYSYGPMVLSMKACGGMVNAMARAE